MPSFDTVARGAEPVTAYRPIFELGRGGMGTVYLARAVGEGGFERLVVIKRLNRELLDEPDAVRRFLDEARHAALIHHANVVGIQQIGRDSEGHFLVLDYVEGASVEELVDRAALRREKLPPPIVLRIGLDALAGLSAAHRTEDASGRLLNLLHRDVSLQNLLVGSDGVTRLADFGIAKSAMGTVSTDQRYIVGKLLYLPREYLARQPVGPTLDIYSLGVTLWIALSGVEPWPGADEAQLVALICQERMPTLADVGVHIAPQVESLLSKACDPDPLRRFASAREMADAVESIGRETGWLASHAEVSELTERLLGVDLARRRERIRSLTTGAAPPSEAMTHHSVPPPPPDAEVSATRSLGEGTSRRGELPMTRTKAPWAIAAALLLVAAYGIFRLDTGRHRSRDEQGTARDGGFVRALASARDNAPSPPAAAPLASTDPAPAEASSASAQAPLQHVVRAGARPTASQPPRTTQAASAPSVESVPAPGEPVSRPRGDGISKKNPYR